MRKILIRGAIILTCVAVMLPAALAQTKSTIPPGSKVYIHPMDGFEKFLAAGLEAKKVPLTVVPDRSRADFECTGTVGIDKEEGTKGWQKVAEIGLTAGHRGTEFVVQASLNLADTRSGDTVFAYTVVKKGGKAQQSAAEAFAKHLKNKMQAK